MTTPVYNPWSAMARTAANRSDEAGRRLDLFAEPVVGRGNGHHT